jgi:polysaccharide pyruvyl transferase WcaK-like protein
VTITSPSRYILYGTEAAPRPPLPLAKRARCFARRQFHSYLDIARFRQGDLSRLDYRNYVSEDTVNLGDVAIAQTSAALIRQVAPAAEITPINWGELQHYPLTPLTHQQTTLIFNGSGYFFIESNGRLAQRIRQDLAFLQRYRIPAVFCGVGLNRPGQTDLDDDVQLHPEDAELIRQLLNLASAVSVRDATTQATLAALCPQPVHLTGDPALHFAHALGMPDSAADTRPAGAPPVIGVNFSFHGKNSTVLLKKNLEEYCNVLLRLQKETGAEFRYFIHYAACSIVPNLLAQRGIHIKKIGADNAADTSLLAAEYAKLDLHIGGMLHSCILATSAGTPCIALAYDIKHQGFFDLMGLPDNCLSAVHFDPDELYARALALLADPAPVRAQITARRDELHAATLSFLRNTLPA